MTEQPDLLQKLLSKVPGSVHAVRASADGAMKMIYASEGTAALCELPVEAILDDISTLNARYHPDDLLVMQQAVIASAQQRKRLQWQGRFVFDGGERIKWIRLDSMPEVQPDQSIIWYGTMLDVTDEVLAQQQVERAHAAQEQQTELFRSVIDLLPVGVTVMDARGQIPISNRMSEQIFGQTSAPDPSTIVATDLAMFLPDRTTPYPVEQLPLMLAIAGETVDEVDMFVRSPARPEGFMITISARPLRREGATPAAVMVMRDVTSQRELEAELQQRNQQLMASESEKDQLVERLRLSIDELSNPILEVWDDVLAVPLIGLLDARRTADMTERLLSEVARTQARCVILDLTGVETIDGTTADHIGRMMRGVELIGARCFLTGIRPAVAQAMTALGVEFASNSTLRTLRNGLQAALRHRHQRAGEPGGAARR